MASAISGGVGRDVLCLTRAHGSCMNLCGCTRDLSWGLWAAGWAAEPRPPITAVASLWDRRDPLPAVARAAGVRSRPTQTHTQHPGAAVGRVPIAPALALGAERCSWLG